MRSGTMCVMARNKSWEELVMIYLVTQQKSVHVSYDDKKKHALRQYGLLSCDYIER